MLHRSRALYGQGNSATGPRARAMCRGLQARTAAPSGDVGSGDVGSGRSSVVLRCLKPCGVRRSNLELLEASVGSSTHELLTTRRSGALLILKGVGGSKRPQDGPKMAPRGSDMAPRGPKIFPRGPKITPRGSKRPQEAPRGPKKAPRWPQEAPRWPREAPR